jgi:hypothetical protein
MAHDVFISYSSKDKPAADATCAVLESKGVRCWIAPRDIMPGSDWGEAIVDAIHASRAFVLVFSENANLSQQIKREVERAVSAGSPIIPLRIENVVPTKTLEYFLSSPHWLDAFTPPLENHLKHLADVIHHILNGEPPPASLPAPPSPSSHKSRRVLIGSAAVGVGLIGIFGWLSFVPAVPPSFVGKWTAESITVDPDAPSPFGAFSISIFLKAAVQGKKLSGNFEVGEIGQYKADFGGDDTGTVVANSRDSMIFTSDNTHESTVFNYIAINPQTAAGFAAALGGKVGDSAIALTAPATAQSVLVGTAQGRQGEAIGPIVGHWYTHTPANGTLGAVTTSLDVKYDGHYHYHFDIAESGIWQASDGKWRRTPQGAVPVSGTYKFSGTNRVTCAAANGVTAWIRTN